MYETGSQVDDWLFVFVLRQASRLATEARFSLECSSYESSLHDFLVSILQLSTHLQTDDAILKGVALAGLQRKNSGTYEVQPPFTATRNKSVGSQFVGKHETCPGDNNSNNLYIAFRHVATKFVCIRQNLPQLSITVTSLDEKYVDSICAHSQPYDQLFRYNFSSVVPVRNSISTTASSRRNFSESILALRRIFAV